MRNARGVVSAIASPACIGRFVNLTISICILLTTGSSRSIIQVIDLRAGRTDARTPDSKKTPIQRCARTFCSVTALASDIRIELAIIISLLRSYNPIEFVLTGLLDPVAGSRGPSPSISVSPDHQRSLSWCSGYRKALWCRSHIGPLAIPSLAIYPSCPFRSILVDFPVESQQVASCLDTIQ